MTSTGPLTTLRARTVALPGGALDIYEATDPEAALDRAIALGRPAPYGAVLWESAECVAALLEALLPTLAAPGDAPVRVLELGCGTGLCALSASRAGARVLATDVDEDALAAVAHAATSQGLTLQTALFDVLSDAPLPPADVVVAADVLYEEPLALALGRRAREALAAGALVVVGDPGRTHRAAFVRATGAVFVDREHGAARAAVAVLNPRSAP